MATILQLSYRRQRLLDIIGGCGHFLFALSDHDVILFSYTLLKGAKM